MAIRGRFAKSENKQNFDRPKRVRSMWMYMVSKFNYDFGGAWAWANNWPQTTILRPYPGRRTHISRINRMGPRVGLLLFDRIAVLLKQQYPTLNKSRCLFGLVHLVLPRTDRR